MHECVQETHPEPRLTVAVLTCVTPGCLTLRTWDCVRDAPEGKVHISDMSAFPADLFAEAAA